MRNLLLITFAVLCIFSCRKDTEKDESHITYLSNIIKGLKDSLSVTDYANINVDRAIITSTKKGWSLLRIPFKGKKLSEEFVLLQSDSSGQILKGLIVNLNETVTNNDSKYVYNGAIKISYLNRREKLISDIENGVITALHHRVVARMMDVVPSSPSENVLPEVIVTCYIQSGGNYSSYNSINLASLGGDSYGGSSGYSNSGYYSYLGGTWDDVAAGTTTGGGGSQNDYKQEDGINSEGHGRFIEDDPELVDFEFVENFSPVDIMKYVKCFSNIPDYGSTCSIEILVDIPVDVDPNSLFDYKQGSPGHTFLQITKSNGSQSVTQNIGFYPASTWKMLLTEPVKSKIVDNGEHEFNASLKMNITPVQLSNTLNELSNLNSLNYDIDDYNCTDFALKIFNELRSGNSIEIQKIQIPGGRAPNGTNTPGALYNKLKVMQLTGIESGNINFPGTKAYVQDSNGPCN